MSSQRFISTIPGTLDAKGRVCIPAGYRTVLAAQNTDGVYICPSLITDSLDCFGEVVMEEACEKVRQYDTFQSPEHDEFAAHVPANSIQLPIDENGRVRLPDPFIQHAKLKDRVLFVGMVERFEIWNPETFEAVREQRLAGARAARVRRTPLPAASVAATPAEAAPAVPEGGK